MIHRGVDEDPHVAALLSAMPKFILKRIQPHPAAAALVDGLERRRRTVTVPGRWRPVSALRGILGPMVDARLAYDVGVQRALAELEARWINESGKSDKASLRAAFVLPTTHTTRKATR